MRKKEFRKIYFTLTLGIFCSFLCFFIWNQLEGQVKKNKVTSFQEAKRYLHRLYAKVGVDFYCGCRFARDESESSRLLIDQTSCGLAARKNGERQKYIEWEHIVPAYSLGKNRPCWTQSPCEYRGKPVRGRKCCQAVDPEFNQMEADMHNIVPVPGEINADRSHYFFGLIPGEERVYGDCDFEVHFKNQLAEPKEEIRGDIARIYLYMENEWKIPIPQETKTLYESWNLLDPPDTFEIRKNEIVERIQGRKNPFIP